MRWSAVVAVYNEAELLPRMLRSMAAQTEPVRLIVVDNGSTDGCIEAAGLQIETLGLEAVIVHEPKPGQVHALKRGLSLVVTDLVAVCDADTWYPPTYLQAAQRQFDEGGPACVAANAYLKREGEADWRDRLSRAHRLGAARLMPRQNHTSGAAQSFRTEALRAAGGYDADIWPYVLKDHELMHRVLKLGAQRYHADLWCVSSPRRTDRRRVRWTLPERLAYHLWPFERKDAFFHRFLAQRFEQRGQRDLVLRQREWDTAGASPP